MIAILDLDDTILDLETPHEEAFPTIEHYNSVDRFVNREEVLEAIQGNNLLENLTPLSRSAKAYRTITATKHPNIDDYSKGMV